MTSNMTALAKVIKKARARQGITQKELAEKIGCSIPHLGRIEIGASYPSGHLFEKICDALDGVLYDLFPLYDNEQKNQLISDMLANFKQLNGSDLEIVANLTRLMAKKKKNSEINTAIEN